MEKWTFKLDKPIKVTKKGEFEDSYEITFTAPNYKCRDAAAKIEQCISRAMVSMSSDVNRDSTPNDDDSDNKIDGKAVKFLLTQSCDDMKHMYNAFESIAVNTGIVLDGVMLTNNSFQQLSLSDYNSMCYGYIANFIASPLLESVK